MRHKGHIVLLAVGLLISGSVFFIEASKQPDAPCRLSDLLSSNAVFTTYADILDVSLACMEGLVASNVERSIYRTRLDEWTSHVRKETACREIQFSRNPGYYDNSKAKFQMIQLVLTLQEDYKIRYDPWMVSGPSKASIQDPSFFRNPDRIFITGLLGDSRRGTCSSLPVLVTAIGRALGYPLRLVSCKGHLFARWESKTERFNIECAGRGVDFHPDEYYKRWPVPCSEAEARSECYFKSLTPTEEISLFLQLRGFCLDANKRYSEAAGTYVTSLRMNPHSVNLRNLTARAQKLAVNQ